MENKTMYAIYARNVLERVAQPIATFDTKEDAEEYLEASKLQRARKLFFPFRKRSLLGQYTVAFIEPYVLIEPTHNPEIYWLPTDSEEEYTRSIFEHHRFPEGPIIVEKQISSKNIAYDNETFSRY